MTLHKLSQEIRETNRLDDDKALSTTPSSRSVPPIHPIGFAIWPVIALYGQNVETVEIGVVVSPILLFAAMGVALPIVFRVVTSNWAKASLMATVVIVALCVIWKPIAMDILLFRSALTPWVFYSLYGLFLVLFLVIIQQSHGELRGSASVLNVVALVMLAWPIYQISNELLRRPILPILTSIDQDDLPGNMATTTDKPNVVLLFLDEYSRADVLTQYYDFDNRDFLQALEDRGFVVARESMSNYNATTLSVPSALNMDYLSSFVIEGARGIDYRALMESNYVLRLFNAMDYETYAFITGFPVVEPEQLVDHVLPANGSLVSMSEFLGTLLDLSPANAITTSLGKDFTHELWRNNILHTLENLHRPIAEAGDRPVYVRAHVVSPHPPFVFRADGGPRQPAGTFEFSQYEGRHRNRLMVGQIKGLNGHVLKAIDQVLAASKEPPIIIITADHATVGTGTPGRTLEILFAAYLPGAGQRVPREEIDSMHLVNMFRLVFNTYFDAEFPMLENKGLTYPKWLEMIMHGDA